MVPSGQAQHMHTTYISSNERTANAVVAKRSLELDHLKAYVALLIPTLLLTVSTGGIFGIILWYTLCTPIPCVPEAGEGFNYNRLS